MSCLQLSHYWDLYTLTQNWCTEKNGPFACLVQLRDYKPCQQKNDHRINALNPYTPVGTHRMRLCFFVIVQKYREAIVIAFYSCIVMPQRCSFLFVECLFRWGVCYMCYCQVSVGVVFEVLIRNKCYRFIIVCIYVLQICHILRLLTWFIRNCTWSVTSQCPRTNSSCFVISFWIQIKLKCTSPEDLIHCIHISTSLMYRVIRPSFNYITYDLPFGHRYIVLSCLSSPPSSSLLTSIC